MILLEMLSYPFLARAMLVGILVSLCAALLGTSLVLKRYSMIGDGLSHVGFGALAIASALGLAPLVVRDIFSIIRRLSEEGITILLIEQNANAALHAAHYGYVLETGQITLSGTGEELLASKRVQEAYLGKGKKHK